MTTNNKKAKTTTQSLIASESFIDIDSHEELTTTNDTLIVKPFEPAPEIDEVTELKNAIESLKEQIKTKQKRIRELTKPASTKGPNKKQMAIEWLTNNPDEPYTTYIMHCMQTLEVSPVYAATVYKGFKKT
jgi:hypothetical protein